MKSTKTALVKTAFILALVICLTKFISSPVALVLGFLFSYFFGHPFQKLNQKAVGWLLKIAVIGIGFGLNARDAINVSQDGLFLTVSTIVLVLILGYFIGRLINVQRNTTHLISSGTAICGGSAIATIAPVIEANEKEISVSLGVVFLLNSIALVIFPFIGKYLQLSEYQFGLWCAVAIHDTSSVVGAASTYGNQALDVATTVKMARVFWIIPLSIISMFLFKGKNHNIKVPWFIFLFIAAILLNTNFELDTTFTQVVTGWAKRILVLTLFLVGAGLSVEKIVSAGWRPLLLGLLLWMVISVFSLLLIL